MSTVVQTSPGQSQEPRTQRKCFTWPAKYSTQQPLLAGIHISEMLESGVKLGPLDTGTTYMGQTFQATAAYKPLHQTLPSPVFMNLNCLIDFWATLFPLRNHNNWSMYNTSHRSHQVTARSWDPSSVLDQSKIFDPPVSFCHSPGHLSNLGEWTNQWNLSLPVPHFCPWFLQESENTY